MILQAAVLSVFLCFAHTFVIEVSVVVKYADVDFLSDLTKMFYFVKMEYKLSSKQNIRTQREYFCFSFY